MKDREFRGKLTAAAVCLWVLIELIVVRAWLNTGESQREEKVRAGAVTMDEVERLLPEAEDFLKELKRTASVEREQGTEALTRTCFELLQEEWRNRYGVPYQAGEGEYIYPDEFLDWYEEYVSVYPEQGKKKEILWIVQANEEQLVTNEGRFYLEKTYRYDRISREEGRGGELTADAAHWEGKAVEAVHDGNTLLYIRAVSKEEVCLPNVWLISAEGNTFDIYLEGVRVTLKAGARLSEELKEEVADLWIADGLITRVTLKSERITGKVLNTKKDRVEIAGYGELLFAEEFRIYKIYGELGMEATSSILVGYENTDFVVSDGKICAALLTEEIRAENIRVLLSTDGYQGYYHTSVELTGDTQLLLSGPDGEEKVEAGEKVTITPEMAKKGRITVSSSGEEGKITLLSLKRADGAPAYRGSIEIAAEEDGLLLVNELTLEEYLYAVIPSEMPVSYGLEPLKVQAVCARSYACRQLYANRYAEYGAHVDDSVSCQVYNNIAETQESILAVKDTYGKVITDGAEVITAYYFSTSCGSTTGAQEVWANHVPQSYLTGQVQTKRPAGEAEEGEAAEEALQEDRLRAEELKEEETFRAFLASEEETYDSEFAWYRWSTVLTAQQLEESIDRYAAQRYRINPSSVLTLCKEGDEVRYESVEPEPIGTVQSMEVTERGIGGIVKELLVRGENTTLLIRTEYNIRLLLSPAQTRVIRKDGSAIENMSLLPSGFFVIDEVSSGTDNSAPAAYQITGGGYGHGAGMSQNGVKAMADEGYTWEEIVSHYYSGTSLGFLYE